MTFLEAIQSIDLRVGKCRINHSDGNMIEPSVAIGKIGVFHGERYDHVIESLKTGSISIDSYYLEMIKMISEYQHRERSMNEKIYGV